MRKPKHPDRNAVSNGKFTVGKKADYADWNAALSDISTTVDGPLIFTQISDLSYIMAGITPSFTLSDPTAKVVLQSASPLKGNGGAGLLTEDLGRTGRAGFDIDAATSAGNDAAYVEIKDLYFASAGPGSTRPFIRTNGSASGPKTLFKIHDCILYGHTETGYGITRGDGDQRFQLWNCKFMKFQYGKALQVHGQGNSESFIENNVFYDSLYGIYQEDSDSVKVNNCVAYASGATDFFVQSSGAGDNNVSGDASAADFDGEDNLINQPAALDFENTTSPPVNAGFFRLKPTATILPAAGKSPEIPDNTMGSKGNKRPGMDGLYSAGADELEELFPDNWDLFTKLTVNKEKISGSSAFTMPILITERALIITQEIWHNSRDDGGDLRLTTGADGSGMLPIEVVSWDRVNYKCEIWALVEVDPTQDIELYLWSANPHAAQPEPNDTRDDRGSFNVWQQLSSTQGFVYHCANDPSDKYAYDSSPAKMHAPVRSGPLTQVDSPWGYGKAFEFEENAFAYLDFGSVFEFTDSAQRGFILMNVQHITTDVGAFIFFKQNGSSANRVWIGDSASSIGFYVWATAPDGGTSQTQGSFRRTDDLLRHTVGARINLGLDEMDTWVDGDKGSSIPINFGASSFTAGTHSAAAIGEDTGSPRMHFYGQEIRYWNSDYTSSSEDDEFWQTHNDMILDQLGFWSCGDLHGQDQVGNRKWQFLVPEVGCLGVENTDFWIEYTSNQDGTLSAILHAVWDAGSRTTLSGVAKRVELEGRLEELRHTFETLRGDLLIDQGTAYEKLIRGVQLSSVALKEGKTNAALDYDLTFVVGLADIGMRSIARTLEFGAHVLNAGNFLVEYTGGDRTVFKDVFRAAAIRVPSGPVTKSILVTAIVESVAASTPLARRQKVEQKAREWAWDILGEEGELKVDGVTVGTAHLAGVQPSRLELPDAIVFDLEFRAGYGS